MAAAVAHAPPGGRDLAAILARLADLGPPSEIRTQSPRVAAAALDLDRVLLTSLRDGTLVAEAAHPADLTLAEGAIALEYPLIEVELMRRRQSQIVRGAEPARRALAWADYVAAPILLDGRAIGFLHGDRGPSGRPLRDDDATDLAAFALCLALVFERAVLRRRLLVQRQELHQLAAWADGRTSALGERAVSLAEDDAAPRAEARAEPRLRDLLTPRELEVLELMVRGDTNAGIARELVLSEGTVKFHVKNILRKLHVANRAEATSRYLHLTLGAPAPA